MQKLIKIEIEEVPSGSVLKCDPAGRAFWETPEGEILIFDLETLIKENKS